MKSSRISRGGVGHRISRNAGGQEMAFYKVYSAHIEVL